MGFIEYTLTFGLDILLLSATLSYICRLLAASYKAADRNISGGDLSGSACLYEKRSLLNQSIGTRSIS